ncbi:MAG TPA: hypothetical protein VE864_05200 [Streptosporangiaceae bacterium]|nr:hypothetical protein [Streptosporangiaceae bacterium]
MLITSGDPGGIGPELVLRALADPATAARPPAAEGRPRATSSVPVPGGSAG